MKSHWYYSVFIIIVIALSSCSQSTSYHFDKTFNRTWIGSDFLAIPMEDWQVNKNRVECVGASHNMRVNNLTHVFEGEGNFEISVQMGMNSKDSNGKVGLRIGLQDETDNDVRSLCYYGKGVEVSISTKRKLSINDKSIDLPEQFDLSSFTLVIKGSQNGKNSVVQCTLIDETKNTVDLEVKGSETLNGIIAVFSQLKSKGQPAFWFDNLEMEGAMVKIKPENSFGPILFSMYTLDKRVMRMTVQMPPLGTLDEDKVVLKIKRGEEYVAMGSSKISKDSRIAVFQLKNWPMDKTRPFRIEYKEKQKNGDPIVHTYEGTIQPNPTGDKLSMAGLTCQHWQAFPYRPLTDNLKISNPDILYFSGDQIYEANGGYGIERENPEKAILNYLGKWYMFGWAFRDLMKDRPTICIPDDHEVYQGNLWGDGGKKITLDDWKSATDCTSGFVQPLEMIKVVMETNTSHLPKFKDSTPMDNGIPVYFTDMLYGGISFAIVGDRIFKSGPEEVSWWEGRKDHIKTEIDTRRLEKDKLKLLGERQLGFIDEWSKDWVGAEMKCFLSQTVFNNSATHHGDKKEFLYGDMDSGGWPKVGRDKAVEAIRSAGAIHVCGDQHLPSLQQYGINTQRDAGWVFCTPAISVGYERRFLPDEIGKKHVNRPEHGYDNTGEYTDAFGNLFYMYAVGNPESVTNDKNRYIKAQKRASGYGMIEFNKAEKTITFDAIPFLAYLKQDTKDNHFPGWPFTINQADNLGSKNEYWLPTFKVDGDPNVLITVSKGDKRIYSYRIRGNVVTLPVYESGDYEVNFEIPENSQISSMFPSLRATTKMGADTLSVNMDSSVGFIVKEIRPGAIQIK